MGVGAVRSGSLRWPCVQTGRAGRLLLGVAVNLTPPSFGKAADSQCFTLEKGKALQSEESAFQKPRGHSTCEH